MKKLLVTLLAIVMTVSVLVACGQGSTNGGDTTDAPGTTVTPPGSTEDGNLDENGFVKDNLPEDLDFDGTTINIVVSTHNEDLFFCEDEEQETNLDAAIRDRNETVETRLGVKLNYIPMDSGYPNQTAFFNTIGSSISGNNGSYDLVGVAGIYSAGMAINNYAVNLLTNPYIDLDMPWWPASLQEETTVNGQLYFVGGSAAVSSLREMLVLIVNTEMLGDLKLDSIYDLVNDGQWTLDKMSEFISAAYLDSNVDTEKRYGYVSNWKDDVFYTAFCISSGLRLTEMGDDGYPYLNLGTDRTASIVSAIYDKIASNTGTYNSDPYSKEFENERSLFLGTTLKYLVSNVSDVEFTYGIVPLPMYDEDQGQYYTYPGEQYDMFSIAMDSKNFDAAGAVLEAMASENYRSVNQVFYEQALKVRYSRDDETAQMLDIIRDSISYNFGLVYAGSFNWTPVARLRVACFKGDSWPTVYAQYADIWAENMVTFLRTYQNYVPES